MDLVLHTNPASPMRPAPADPATTTPFGLRSDAAFLRLLSAFRGHAGLARGDEVARLMTERNGGGTASLARQMVAGDLIWFAWQSEHWLPMFQFDRRDMSLRSGVRCALGELRGVYDGWELSMWFAEPHAWLDGRRPLDVIDDDVDALVEAARVDRFVACG